MKRYSTLMSVLLTLALPIAGNCADAPKAPEKADSSVESVAKPAGHPMAGAPAAATAAPAGNAPAAAAPAATAPPAAPPVLTPTGKVLETMNAGGYTYANVEQAGKQTWVAYPVQETRVGETLSFKNCMEMSNFQSKALNRKFDSILFCGAPEVAGGAKAAPAKAAAREKGTPGGKIKVDKATGANAYTVAEIFAKSGALKGKQIVVKGQVVKVASGIMNKNWIHLQDGSGSEAKKTNDLVVTTNDMAEEGDIITISGTLAKDKDFGGGYKYKAIIEKGSIKK